MERLSLAWLGAALALAACEPPAPALDAGLGDAGLHEDASALDASREPVACADRALRVVFPSPAWQPERALTLPSEDRVASELARLRPGWAEDLEGIEGWPRRPVLVMPLAVTPLAGETVDYDASRIHVAVRSFGESAAHLVDAELRVLVSGDALVVRPLDAAPRDVDVVYFGFDHADLGPNVVPACASGSASVDPRYEAWRSEWPGGPEGAPALVVKLALARSAEPLSALDLALHAHPVLEVGEAHAVTREALGADGPDDATAPHLRFPVAEGFLRLPSYRRAEGPIELDAAGVPVASGVTEPGFLVVLPSRGTAPYPVVLFQHGGGQSPREVFRVAGPLAEAGFAFVAIDLVEHGHRAPAGGGSDLSFLDFDHPLRSRENFRQTVADHLAVLTGLDALEEGVAGALGLAPGTEDVLDASRVFYMGLSLGAISGSLTSQSARELRGAALFVGAAGYPEMLQYGIFRAAVTRVLRAPEPLPWALLAGAGAILDGAEPYAYAARIDDPSNPPISIVQLHAIGDPLISDEASEGWARAFGATLVRPAHHEVASLAIASAPLVDDFERGGERATRAYVQCPMDGVPTSARHAGLIRTLYAQTLVAGCFAGLASGGRCVVTDTGWATP